MAQNEISVGLKLGTEGLKAQGVEAGRLIQEGVKQGSGNSGLATGGATTSKSSSEMADDWRRELAAKAIAANRAWRAGGGKLPPPPGSTPPAAAGGGMSGLPAALSASGIPYVSTLARAIMSPLGKAAAITTVALMAMRKAMTEVSRAMDEARSTYAKSVRSGQGVGHTTSMGNAASVLGISEREVLMFGAAVGMMDAKLATANQAMTRNNAVLTASSWNLAALSKNWDAVWNEFAAGFSTAVNRFAALYSAIAKLAVLSGLAHMLGTLAGQVVDWVTRIVALSSIAFSALEVIATAIQDWANVVKEVINNLIAGTMVGKAMGMKETFDHTKDKAFNNTKAAAEAFKEVLKAGLSVASPYGDKAGVPGATANRMPTGTLEKMGLIIGTSGGQSHAAQTAKNTGKTVSLLEQINKNFPRSGGGGNPSFANGI